MIHSVYTLATVVVSWLFLLNYVQYLKALSTGFLNQLGCQHDEDPLFITQDSTYMSFLKEIQGYHKLR